MGEVYIVVKVARVLRATKEYGTFAEASAEATRLSEQQPHDVFLIFKQIGIAGAGHAEKSIE